MALYLQARDGGKTDEKGLYYHINKLFPGEVVSGFAVTQQGTPSMGVTVATGSIMVPSGNDYPYIGWNDAAANLTVTTADVSNPRRDLVVAYVDLSVVSSVTPNNPNALKLAVVAGTPSGSPVDPNDAAIHAVIGASNPYSILARVAVAAGATTITNAVITDLRDMARLESANVDFDGTGSGIWWEEIGRTSLSVAGDTITVSSLPARKYLQVWVSLLNTGGTIDGLLRFNNDTGTNYAERRSTDGAADATTTSATSIGIIATQSATPRFSVVEIINISNFEKLAHIRNVTQGTAGAATAPSRREAVGKWANTSAQISRIDVVNAGTGDFAVGSEVVVLGHN